MQNMCRSCGDLCTSWWQVRLVCPGFCGVLLLDSGALTPGGQSGQMRLPAAVPQEGS
jgi:hypothetical protein